MHRLFLTGLCIAGLLGLMLNTGHVLAAVPTPATASSISPHKIALRYDNGRLDARIDSAPLGKVLRQLALKTGMQIHLTDPVMAGRQVIASVEDAPLVDGIKQILDGFSYLLFPSANGRLAVVVLSSQADAVPSGVNAGAFKLPGALSDQPQPAGGEKPPQSLEEYQPIPEASSLGFVVKTSDQELSEEDQLAIVEVQYEAIINRALDVLDSEFEHLYPEAAAQLVGMEDPRATQALVEVATISLDAKSRARLVEALSQHAAILQFADASSVTALTQLAQDRNANVSNVARHALEDMQQFFRRKTGYSY